MVVGQRPSHLMKAALLLVGLALVDAWIGPALINNQGFRPVWASNRPLKQRALQRALTVTPTELEKGQQQLVLDLSSFGQLYLKGEDTRRFLHNQMTNDFMTVSPGTVVESSYTTSLGRTIDLVTVLVTAEDEAWVLCSPNRAGDVAKTMGKYIFPLDRVKLTDRSGEKAVFAVVGANAFGAEAAPAPGQCRVLPDGSLLAAGTGLALPGYLLIADQGEKAEAAQGVLRESLKQAEWGGMPDWQTLRVLQGRPYPDQELTLEVTPLEAGLWHTVSFTKGCYLGQETIAKVANNHGERQRLFGFRAEAADAGGVVEGTRLVTSEGARAGAITSVLSQPTGSQEGGATVRGLAYVRKNMGGPGTKLVVEGSGAVVEVVEIPYATRTDVTSGAAALAAAAAEQEKKKTEESAELKAKEAERKAKKLEEMKKRLEAFQKAKGGGQ